MLEKLKKEVYEANMALPEYGLITFTWGNASAIDESREYVVIKPSGVKYEDLEPDMMVVLDLDGKIIEGDMRPSSDTPTHLELYRAFDSINGIVHTHSTYATILSQAKLPVVPYGTTHADYFYGEVPCTREMTKDEIINDYEVNTGKVIIETIKKTLNGDMKAVLVASHGPFTWGSSAMKAVENSVVLETIAKMAIETKLLRNDIGAMQKDLLDKHYFRKHGKNAYYGQDK